MAPGAYEGAGFSNQFLSECPAGRHFSGAGSDSLRVVAAHAANDEKSRKETNQFAGIIRY